MKREAWASAIALAGAAFLLGACSERADVNPNAPGRPGTGNSVEVVKPAVPDGPPGGPSGVAGSVPHPGASGGSDVVPGTTGDPGVAGQPGGGQPAQPGTGLTGGLNDGSGLVGSFPTAPVTGPTSAPDGTGVRGSTNSTGGVGQR